MGFSLETGQVRVSPIEATKAQAGEQDVWSAVRLRTYVTCSHTVGLPLKDGQVGKLCAGQQKLKVKSWDYLIVHHTC